MGDERRFGQDGLVQSAFQCLLQEVQRPKCLHLVWRWCYFLHIELLIFSVQEQPVALGNAQLWSRGENEVDAEKIHGL